MSLFRVRLTSFLAGFGVAGETIASTHRSNSNGRMFSTNIVLAVDFNASGINTSTSYCYGCSWCAWLT